MHTAHSLFFSSYYNDLLNIAKDFYIIRSSNFLFVNKYLLASIIWEREIILFEVFCSLLVNIIFSFFEALLVVSKHNNSEDFWSISLVFFFLKFRFLRRLFFSKVFFFEAFFFFRVFSYKITL